MIFVLGAGKLQDRCFTACEQREVLLKESVYISCGSNKGAPISNCCTAVQYLHDEPLVKINAISSLYLTEPVSTVAQGWFFNFALKVQTDLPPTDFLEFCQQIESRMGRTRTEEARTIDLDLLYYGSQIISSEVLTIPHPRIVDRKFVLVPLAEIAREIIDPVRNRTVMKLLRLTEDRHAVLLYEKKWWPQLHPQSDQS